MKIKVETQFDEVGDEYMQQGEEEIEITTLPGYVYFTVNGTQYEIPIEVFTGIL